MRKFEYKIHDGSPSNPTALEAELNEAGNQGWELINVVHFTYGDQKKVHHYFRREKEEEAH